MCKTRAEFDSIIELLKTNKATLASLELYQVLHNDPDPIIGLVYLLNNKNLKAEQDTLCLETLANSLKENHTLYRLVLKSYCITFEGAKALAEMLAHNKTLVYLDLSRSRIDNNGAKVLAEALKINKTLLTLDLTYNNIDSIGANYFADMIQNNQTLNRIYFTGNAINSVGIKELNEAFRTSKTLQVITHDYGEFYRISGNIQYYSNVSKYVMLPVNTQTPNQNISESNLQHNQVQEHKKNTLAYSKLNTNNNISFALFRPSEANQTHKQNENGEKQQENMKRQKCLK
jgi:Ran GTPase-activating protein (RanGAP) involved in mRNA processing and transport